MSVRCFLYKLYERAKQTWLVRQLVFSGQQYKHFYPITIRGEVAKCEHGLDGDWTFDVRDQSFAHPMHCEVTPCSPKPARELVPALKAGDIVEVSGVLTYDPAHLGGTAEHEVHPVEKIILLGPSPQ